MSLFVSASNQHALTVARCQAMRAFVLLALAGHLTGCSRAEESQPNAPTQAAPSATDAAGAREWLSKAADGGDPWAAYYLGVLLSTRPDFWGTGSQEDFQFGPRSAVNPEAKRAYERFKLLWEQNTKQELDLIRGQSLLEFASEHGVANATLMLYSGDLQIGINSSIKGSQTFRCSKRLSLKVQWLQLHSWEVTVLRARTELPRTYRAAFCC